MPYSKAGTDSINLSISVLELMEYFTIQDKFVMCTINGGYNLKTFQDVLEVKVTNTAIYITHQTMFVQDYFSLHYKLHARQTFWIASRGMIRAQSLCAF